MVTQPYPRPSRALAAYYVWDTAQSQKSHFRLERAGSNVPDRFALPRLPWRTLPNPRFLRTAHGSPLLIDGWWARARKIHYTADIVCVARGST